MLSVEALVNELGDVLAKARIARSVATGPMDAIALDTFIVNVETAIQNADLDDDLLAIHRELAKQ